MNINVFLFKNFGLLHVYLLVFHSKNSYYNILMIIKVQVTHIYIILPYLAINLKKEQAHIALKH